MIETRYDPEADALAVSFRRGATSARTLRVSETVRVDLDAKGRLVTIEVLDASWHVDRAALAALPGAGAELTLAEAEKESGLRATTLRVLLNKGRLQGRKRGRDWVVDARALANYLESRDVRGRPSASLAARRRSAGRRSGR